MFVQIINILKPKLMLIIVQDCDQVRPCITITERGCTTEGRTVCMQRSPCTDTDTTVTACTQEGKTQIMFIISSYNALSKFYIKASNDSRIISCIVLYFSQT